MISVKRKKKTGGCHLVREDSSSAKCQLPCVYVENKKEMGACGPGVWGDVEICI